MRVASKVIGEQEPEKVGSKKNVEGKGLAVKKQLSPRSKLAIKHLLSGKTKKESLLKAGFSPKYVPTNWSNQPGNQQAIEKALRSKGLDLVSLLNKVQILVDKVQHSSDPKQDKNFLELLNIINKLQGNYAPTKVEARSLSVSAKVSVDELLSPEARIEYHRRSLELAEREKGGAVVVEGSVINE